MKEDNINKILITNIQRFSLHDGPGIRTTVFFKGCSLRCPWCSNPENLLNFPQAYIRDGRKGIYGFYYTVDELYNEILKDKIFYEGMLIDYRIDSFDQIDKLPGGVTFSGGECLLQMDELKELLQKLQNEHLHMTVETCLFVPESNLDIALKYFDFFYVDVKILSREKCQKIEKGNLNLYLNNLKKLFSWVDEEGKHKPVVIRIPVIGGYTDDKKNRLAVCELVKMYKSEILKIELIKEHDLGKIKYKSLGMEMSYSGVDDELMELYKSEIEDIVNIPVEICKI